MARTVAVAAHTLELYRQMDLADAVMQHAHAVEAANLWVEGRAVARVPFDSIVRDLSPPDAMDSIRSGGSIDV